jgi:putative endonuclease
MPSRGISNWHYVYVLFSKKDRDLYIGYTKNLRERLNKHNAESNFSTKSRLPLKLIYAESCLNEEDARRRENYLKTSQGRRFIKLRVRKFLNNVNIRNSPTGYGKI